MVKLCEVASQSLNVTLIWEADGSTPTVRSGQWRAEGTSSATRLPEAETDDPLVSHLIFLPFDVSCFLLLGSFRAPRLCHVHREAVAAAVAAMGLFI